MDKYLSIITNFGCHYTCPYCIVKNNHLHIPVTTIQGLQKIRQEIIANNCNWVSISGGGDPLFHIKDNLKWYRELYECIPEGTKLEMHTSIVDNKNMFMWAAWKFDRIVYHLSSFTQLYSIQRHYKEIVRVVFVVTENFSKDLIDKTTEFVKESDEIDELSFRQMIDSNYENTHYCEEYLRSGHKKDWWYIEQCDYNLYYAENKVYTEYRKIGESND